MKCKKRATIVHDTMYYVPLLDSLKVNSILIIIKNLIPANISSYMLSYLQPQALLQREDVQEVETDHCSEDGILRDFCDGSFVRNLTTGESTLFLALYHDDFEVTNPLGSKRGVHKLG